MNLWYNALNFLQKGRKMETMNITFRMNKADKQQFERIINEIGLNLSSAFNIFAKAVIKERKIPFELKAEQAFEPNDETIAAIKRLENNEEVQSLTLDELVKIAKKSSTNA